MQKKEIKDEITILAHIDFVNRIRRYIIAFEEKYGVKMSIKEATKKIDEKIESIGGLSID